MEVKKKRVRYKELVELGLIPWSSWRTTKRKILLENFPAYRDEGTWYFDPREVEMWWKKRKSAA